MPSRLFLAPHRLIQRKKTSLPTNYNRSLHTTSRPTTKMEDEIAEKRRQRALIKKEKEKLIPLEGKLVTPLPDQNLKQGVNYLPRQLKSVARNQENSQNNASLPHKNSVKIMTWNILAQCLVRRTLFPGSDCLKWKDRGPTITQEIIEQDPDVVCLQEVDRLSDQGPILKEAGYEYYHEIGGYEEGGKQHGLLIGWKVEKLRLIGQEVIRLDEQTHESRVGLSRVTRNIGLICALEFNDNTGGLVIGTAHLFWHACFSYERARQTAFLSKSLAQFKVDKYKDTISKWPVFMAGDLNEQPGGPAYRLLSRVNLVEKQLMVLKESSLVHKSVDQISAVVPEGSKKEYITLEGDEDRVFKDVRPARPQDGLFNIDELRNIVGSDRWLSLYGHWGSRMIDEDDNRFINRPGLEAEPNCEDPIGSGHYEPMWTNFTPLWRCTLDYIWVLCKDDDDDDRAKIEVTALLPTHKTQVLEPGLPRLGVEPSDHISLMAQVSIPSSS